MQKIYGRKPIIEALKSGKKIDRIFIQYGQHGSVINQIKQLAKKKNIKVTTLSQQKFSNLYSDKTTQGLVAIKNDFKFWQAEEIIAEAKEKKYPLILLLDSVQDTHNLGAIVRTAECSGVDGIIITSRNSATVNETVNKTSAGAISYVKIAQVNNLVNTIKYLKENGFWIVGSKLGNSKPYTEIDYKQPIALVIGNEEKGIRKLVADNCDFLAEIPMQGKIQSLNVSVATGILLFEILRQRNCKPSRNGYAGSKVSR